MINGIKDKKFHILVFAVVFLIATIMIWVLKDLRNSISSWFGSVGFFVTLYGVIFTIVEVLRVKDANEIADRRVEVALANINNLNGQKEIVECQALIEKIIDKKRIANSTELNQIIKIYTLCFGNEIGNADSNHGYYLERLYEFEKQRDDHSPTLSNAYIISVLMRMNAELSNRIVSQRTYGVKQ